MNALDEVEREDTDLQADSNGSGWALTLIIALSVVGWAQFRSTERQAIVGAGLGGVIGGIIGRTGGNIAGGAIVGAVVGAAAGATLDHKVLPRMEVIVTDVPVPNS